MSSSSTALAQSYAEAYSKYERGDFAGAEVSANQAIAREGRPDVRAKLLKLRGLSEYTRGKTAAASQTFKSALALSPTLKVDEREVLDESVIPFFEMQRPKRTHATAGTQRSPKRGPSSYMPEPDPELFDEPERPAGRDLAAEFDRDTGGSVAQPAMGSTYPNQIPPGAAVCIMPSYPGYMPQPNYPPTTYDEASPPPPQQSPFDPAAVRDPEYDSVVDPPKAKSKGKGQGTSLVMLLPFGAGQFENRSYLLGSLFLTAEASALYFWYDSDKKATRYETEKNNYVKNRYDIGEPLNDADRSYVAETESFVNDSRQTTQTAQIVFAGLWAAGVLEAVINDKPEALPKKKKKKNRIEGFSFTPQASLGPGFVNLVWDL